MRFLLHPRPTAQSILSKRIAGKKVPPQQSKCQTVASSEGVCSSSIDSSSSTCISSEWTKSWGQQCSTDCGCIVRFETTVDADTQRIVHATYHTKSVLTIADKYNTGKNYYLMPIYTMRTHRIMFQECKCETVHSLASTIASYLPGKNIDQIKNMTDFTFTRASPAFRHAVLVENNLPRHHIHCFDVVEEAFTGMVHKTIPGRRRVNAEFQKILRAECLQKPLIVRSLHRRGRSGSNTKKYYSEEHVHPISSIEGMGADKNRLSISSSRTSSTLRMFDINAEYWDDIEYASEKSKQSRMNRLDWVSYVDELYENEESA